jgi:hypothetical protein
MIDDEDDCLENTDHNSTNNLDNISTVGTWDQYAFIAD